MSNLAEGIAPDRPIAQGSADLPTPPLCQAISGSADRLALAGGLRMENGTITLPPIPDLDREWKAPLFPPFPPLGQQRNSRSVNKQIRERPGSAARMTEAAVTIVTITNA